MTLLDYPEKVAATVFLGGCDFRCPFCHNFELVDGSAEGIMTDKELFSFLEKRKGLLDGVTITGGEPCLRKDLKELIRNIKNIGYLVKLDTNGYSPDVLEDLLDSGLIDYVAMDIKNSFAKYELTTGVKELDLSKIQRSISLLLTGSIDYEFRTTVINEFHEDSDFVAIGDIIAGAKAYFLQQYIQRDTVPDQTLTSPTPESMQRFLTIVRPKVPNAALRGISQS